MKDNSEDDLPKCVQGSAMNGNKDENNDDEKDEDEDDDAFAVIQELDAILDIHDESIKTQDATTIITTPTNIVSDININHQSHENIADFDGIIRQQKYGDGDEQSQQQQQQQKHIQDCLKDLDNYLDQIDINNDCTITSSSSDIQRSLFTSNDRDNLVGVNQVNGYVDFDADLFHRHDNTRKTISCPAERKFYDLKNSRNPISNDEVKVIIKENDNNENDYNIMNSLSNNTITNSSNNNNKNNNSGSNNKASQQTLTPEHIYQNILEQSETYRQAHESRPRQYGRRAESIINVVALPRSRSKSTTPATRITAAATTATFNSHDNNCTIVNLPNHIRPFSTPLLTHAAIAYHNQVEPNNLNMSMNFNLNLNHLDHSDEDDNVNSHRTQMKTDFIRSTSPNTVTNPVSIDTSTTNSTSRSSSNCNSHSHSNMHSGSGSSSCNSVASESLTQIGTEITFDDDDDNIYNIGINNNNNNNNCNINNNNDNDTINHHASNSGSTTTASTLFTTTATPSAGAAVASPASVTTTTATTKQNYKNKWPYNCSRTFALLSCTLGLFNICRFALLTIHYGGNFLIQFLILSLIFGVPFFWLQMCLGAKIKNGPITMWRISPICWGIGYALIAVQFAIAIYSAVILVWLLLYLLDIFKYQSSFPWMQTQVQIPIMKLYSVQQQHLQLQPMQQQYQQQNQSYDELLNNLTQAIPNYLNIVVLRRLKFLLPTLLYKYSNDNYNNGDGDSDREPEHDHADRDNDNNHDRLIQFRLNDQVAMSLIVLWFSVFLILFKSLQSLGRVLISFTPFILIALTVITGKFLSVIDLTKFQSIFNAGEMDDFLINSKTWNAAAQETFLTWSLLGASVIAVTSCSLTKISSSSKHALRRDALLVVLLTLYGLCLAGLLGLSCGQILNQAALIYVPGSYETPESSRSIYSMKTLTNVDLISYPSKFVPHYSGYIGEIYLRPVLLKKKESGYQILRFITELLPAAVAVLLKQMSWIWTATLFVVLFLFGINQLCMAWHPISVALGNSTKSIFVSCLCALILSLPFATDCGIIMLHYMDFVMGGAWFIPILWTLEILAIFLIRGRPYNGDHLVHDLHFPHMISAYLALSWNVLLPIGLIALSVINYKISYSSQLYYWRVRSHFTYWARKIGALTQIGLILLVPVVAIIQIYRYLSTGPADILDRILLLYRPPEMVILGTGRRRHSWTSTNRIIEMNRVLQQEMADITPEQTNFRADAPPKYTPPPSYTTATGTRLAKLLRNSIRRSVRRILGSNNRSITILNGTSDIDNSHTDLPNYTNVSTYPSVASNNYNAPPSNSISETIEIEQRPIMMNRMNRATRFTNRTLSLGRDEIARKRNKQSRPLSASRVLDGGINTNYNDDICESQFRRSYNTTTHAQRPYTAEDVITILRSSSTINRHCNRHRYRRTQNSNALSSGRYSHENLVLNAEPPALSAAIMQSEQDQEQCHDTDQDQCLSEDQGQGQQNLHLGNASLNCN